jgi:steroid 5-alpha reductase family enzyme
MKDKLIIAGIYIVAIILFVAVYQYVAIANPIWKFLAADIAATIFVFIMSYVFNNSSVYDPYWSVIPPVICLVWLYDTSKEYYWWHYVVLTLVMLWGVRLTNNWLQGWTDMKHEDWRYISYRELSPRYYWLISFFGIHLFPTFIVFVACIPLYFAINYSFHNHWLNIIAAVVTSLSLLIEWFADNQKRLFKKTASSTDVCNKGLWRYSRHPNYMGEIGFWWGIAIFGIAAWPGKWWLIVGATLVTILFVAISIPMMEIRLLSKKPNYKAYKDNTYSLIPGIL